MGCESTFGVLANAGMSGLWGREDASWEVLGWSGGVIYELDGEIGVEIGEFGRSYPLRGGRLDSVGVS